MSTFQAPILQDRLQSLGIQRILVADDKHSNLRAAMIMANSMPVISFTFFPSAGQLIQAIRTRDTSRTLVITDLCMETASAGFQAMRGALQANIPAFIMSEGMRNPGISVVRLAPCFSCTASFIAGTKATPSLWQCALEYFVAEAEAESGLWPLVLHELRERRRISPIVQEELGNLAAADLTSQRRTLDIVAHVG